jgi:hypothetical protein
MAFMAFTVNAQINAQHRLSRRILVNRENNQKLNPDTDSCQAGGAIGIFAPRQMRRDALLSLTVQDTPYEH